MNGRDDYALKRISLGGDPYRAKEGYRDHGRDNQQYGYTSGSALRNHMDSAHEGKFDIHCRGCVELRMKGFEVAKKELDREGRRP